MLEIKGKYGRAKFALEEQEEAALKQAYNMLNSPVTEGSNIVFMPDNHPGQGCMVGTTMTLTDKICPNFVGVDIGCGMLATRFPSNMSAIDFQKLDTYIRKNIPLGMNRNNSPNKEWKSSKNYNNNIDSILDVAIKTNQNYNDVHNALATMGGGNHFAEIDIDSEGNLWFVIHTGSRHFGLIIAEFHQKKAQIALKETYRTSGDVYKDMEFLTLKTGNLLYLEHMKVAQKYASLNRELITKTIFEGFFNISTKDLEFIESIHNYINFEDNILRKGAISARKGENVFIPLNMLDGSIIGTGLGNSEWNFSAPHGAGRIGSRNAARQNLSLEKYEKSMKAANIWSSSVNLATLDEAPDAYKSPQIIINSLPPTVKINKFLKPVYVLKDDSEKNKRHKATKEEKLAYAKRYAETKGHGDNCKT